jgi:hypothetical protein
MIFFEHDNFRLKIIWKIQIINSLKKYTGETIVVCDISEKSPILVSSMFSGHTAKNKLLALI